MRVLISGSHGTIGSALVSKLTERGDEVTRLVRSQAQQGEICWNPMTGEIEDSALEGFDAVIHLMGAPMGEKRWSPREKKLLLNSRILSTEMLSKYLADAVIRPKTFICASAIGYYGDKGENEITESSDKGEGFLSDLCAQWEEATKPAAEAGIRTINMRSGRVLTPKGGALKQQIPLFKLLLGGRLGSGRQYTSWISLEDDVNAIIHLLENKNISGPVNMVSPQPVRNDDYTFALGRALNRPPFIPAPRWMIAMAFGYQLTDEMLLASQRVIPKQLLDSGFVFHDTEINETLVRMLQKKDKKTSTATETAKRGFFRKRIGRK